MMAPVSRLFGYLGPALISCILLAGLFMILGPVFADTADLDAEVTIGNIFPTVSAVSLNNNSDIVLTANATTAISISFTVTDYNGCTDVFENGNTTSTGYRVSLGGACAADNLNCYRVATSTHDCESATSSSANATATLEIYYFADATDASSSYSGEYWEALVEVADSGGSTSSATSTGVELNTLVSVVAASSGINYGTLDASSTTGFVNQNLPLANGGNATSGLQVHGTALVSGSNSIATSSQHYATSSFYYGGDEQTLQETATTVSGVSLLPRISLINDLGAWTDTTALPNEIANSAYTNDTGYTYVLGGNSTTTVSFAPFNADRTVGSWADTTALPTVQEEGSAVTYNGYIYSIGGQLDDPTRVYYAPVNSTGSLGSWSATTNRAPSWLSNLAVVVNNGYIYSIGGLNVNLGEKVTDVVYAPINTDGTIGSWTNTTALPNVLAYHAAVVNAGYVYVFGGGIASGATSTVRYAAFNSSGTIGSWTDTTALPSAFTDVEAVVNNGYVYVTGGNSSTVRYAAFNSDGTLGSWTNTTALPSAFSGGSVVNSGYIYVAGGNVVSTTTVRYAPINNGLSGQDTFWGLRVPTLPSGAYSGVNTFTASYVP